MGTKHANDIEYDLTIIIQQREIPNLDIPFTLSKSATFSLAKGKAAGPDPLSQSLLTLSKLKFKPSIKYTLVMVICWFSTDPILMILL
jgi:hypothetical protein